MKLFIAVALAVLGTAYATEINICEGVPANTFIRDVSDCANWFRCTASGPVPGRCPDPFLFNERIGECDWAENVECFQCSPTEPIRSTPVAGSCTQFIRCINGQASQHACQNGLHFNAATQQCDLPANANCTINFSCPANIPPGQMLTFRSTTNCSEFTICIGGRPDPIQDSCNPQLHFDPISQQCVFPNMTDCTVGDDGGSNPGPGDPPGTTPLPFNCPSDGHHPHPTTCSSFIVCASGTPHFFNCSDGLHFNSRTNQCDLPANAQCVRT